MERNPGAWRKMAGLLILLALCILPCGAETSNRQRIIALDSEVYQKMKEQENFKKKMKIIIKTKKVK